MDIYGGIANYQGDLQTKRFNLNESQPAFGLGLSYDINEKIIVRGSANYIKLSASDEIPTATKDLVLRNLRFKSVVWEAQLAVEYNILDIEDRGFTPYIFAGVAAFHFNPYSFDLLGNKVFLRSLSTEGQGLSQYPEKKQYSNNQMALPFGAGIKFGLSDKLQAGIEVGLRKLFTDYLDDVSGTYADSSILAAARGAQATAFAYRGSEIAGTAGYPAADSQRGNPKLKDWYYTMGIKISYRIMGGNSNRSGKKSRTGCPVNVF
jgi:opacity protein-like surface antigen